MLQMAIEWLLLNLRNTPINIEYFHPSSIPASIIGSKLRFIAKNCILIVINLSNIINIASNNDANIIFLFFDITYFCIVGLLNYIILPNFLMVFNISSVFFVNYFHFGAYIILGDFMAIVSTNKFYTSELLYSNIRDLLSTYPFLQSEIIGFSVLRKSYSVYTSWSWS